MSGDSGDGRPHATGVASPCIRNCCLDDADICLGCGRSVGEIVRWSGMTDDERSAVLEVAVRRRAARDNSR